MVNVFSGNFDCLDDILWVNNEGCMVSQIFIFMYVVEVMGQGVSWVVDYCIFDFSDGFRVVVLCFVGEVSIGRYCVYVYVQFLQFFVVVSNVIQFGWVYESKVSWVEEEDVLVVFGIFFGDFDEFVVFECLVFKRFNFGVN